MFNASDSEEVWMKRTEMLQAVRRMKFESVLDRWQRRQLSQAEATEVLGMSERSFRRWRDRGHKKTGWSHAPSRESHDDRPSARADPFLPQLKPGIPWASHSGF